MELIQLIKDSGKSTCAEIRNVLYKKGILSNYNQLDGRMICYTSINNRFNLTSKSLNLVCNGIVIDIDKLKLLVVPQLNCISNLNTDIANTYLYNDLYDIYKLEDGTVINLYWWSAEDRWIISTKRSYDSTDKKYNTKSYKEIISDIIIKSNDEKTNENAFYDTLDKGRSYTFGIKHPDIHPFNEGTGVDIYKMWFIQSVDLEKNNVYYEYTNNINIHNQQLTDNNIVSIRELYGKLPKAYNDFHNNNNVNYGYILKSRDYTKTNEYSIILLESSLMKMIRSLLYNNKFTIVSHNMNYDKQLYTILNAYLFRNNYRIFKQLFPQYSDVYRLLKYVTGNILIDILNIKKSVDNNAEVYYKASKNIYNSLIIKCITFDVPTIKSYIRNISWVNIYYDIMIDLNINNITLSHATF